MKLSKVVQDQIENLTDNEDFRQDLWVAHLSGQQQLPTILQSIKTQHDKTEEFQRRLHLYAAGEFNDIMSQLLDNFSSVERSIIYMLMLGYSTPDIGSHYSTSVVHIRQSILIIQKHSIWSKLLTLV